MPFLIRNVEARDFKDLRLLGRELNTVNLPSDPGDLKNIIQRSLESFAGKFKKQKHKAQFLFVIEDVGRGKVIGASKVFARHGTPERPHVYFEVLQEKVTSATLRVDFLRKFYRLRSDKRGYTEIGGLVLDKKYRGRKEKLGKQLSLIRFLWMKAHPTWFKRRLIAELLPPLHGNGQSRLYDFYGFPLTRIPYNKADLLSYRNKEFILKLFPKSDLYFDILPEPVQEDMEKTGPGSEIAKHLLKKIGFSYAWQVDPFDGGPYFTAALSQVSVYRKTCSLKLSGYSREKKKRSFLLLGEKKGKVRGLVAKAVVKKSEVFLSESNKNLLGMELGTKLWVLPWS